jgi:8-oxo-dGTP diphosphatase
MGAVRVAAGVIVRGGRILVCQRRPGDRHPGKWEFPGGKLEPGETPAACIRRELREELGVEVEPGGELWSTRHGYAEIDVELVFLRIESMHGEPRNLCFAEIRWVGVADLASIDFLDADRGFVAAVARGEIPL